MDIAIVGEVSGDGEGAATWGVGMRDAFKPPP